MAIKNNTETLSKANPHTINVVRTYREIYRNMGTELLDNQYCKDIVFIDCMFNSGIYHDDNEEIAYSTTYKAE